MQLGAELVLPEGMGWPEDFEPEDAYFFCFDNQVNSDSPQRVGFADGGRLGFALESTEFAPEDATHLAGVLYHPMGWPGAGSCWIEVAAEWGEDSG